MQLSVIILNYKVPYYLMQCLASVKQSLQGLDAEIIVIDNNSEDESCALVKKHFPEVNLIENPLNEGFSRGNNRGIAKAKGELICLLNPDTAVGKNTFKKLIAFSKDHPDFGAIGPKLFDGGGNFLPESKRNVPLPKIALKRLFNRTKDYYSSLPVHETGKVDVLTGAFMLMRKDRYHEVSGLDEDYFMYGEDIDLCYKFLKAGYHNYYVGSEPVLHYKGESPAKDEVYRKHFYGAMTIFYQKHFQKNAFTRIFVDLGSRLAKASHSLRKKSIPELSNVRFYAWIGTQDNFTDKLKNILDKELIIIDLNEVENHNISEAIVIFDGNQLSYDQIFKQIDIMKNTENQFRIRPPEFNFILGSSRSIDKGEVIQIN